MIDLNVQSIVVKSYRIIVLVKINGQKYSNAQLKDYLLNKFPSLKFHKCKNKSGQNFIEIMDRTSIAHIFEHLIIDYQINYAQNNDMGLQTLFGTTEWVNKEEGIARIEFSYFDDIVALNAINYSLDCLAASYSMSSSMVINS